MPATRLEQTPARDRTRIAGEQNRERVLHLRDLRFDQRNLRCSGLVLRLRLGEVHPRDLPILELQFEESHRLRVGIERLLRDHELRI